MRPTSKTQNATEIITRLLTEDTETRLLLQSRHSASSQGKGTQGNPGTFEKKVAGTIFKVYSHFENDKTGNVMNTVLFFMKLKYGN